ncbi:FUSC family protein [Cellulomonas sp. ES6]|uniref:FUSC family protein n=1 Tax=Cellulomonas sp. ES6 TaxID=3039384 RepID=UPI0024B69D34|nr:FUSC family protein [Cellulomonas sp. ES6]WHP18682.1 FUSC family protein [Cellulomonas sp. ES6]
MHRLSLAAALLHPSQLRADVRPRPGGPSTRESLGGALRCGASVALAFVLVAALGRQDLAGYASLGALASLYGRSSGYAWRLRLMALVGTALTAAVAAMSALSAAGAPVVVELAALTLLAAGATAGAVALRTGPPGATILVFAAGAGAAAATGAGDVAGRAVAVAGGALVACLVCNAGRVLGRHRSRPADAAPRVRDVVREGTAGGAALSPTLSVAVAAALAASVAVAAGWGHPAWAVMGATAVLQGAHVRHMGVRALQRAAGTTAGVALALPLLDAHLPFWAVAALVVVLQTATELVVARHYGAAMLTITPMALLMTSLGAPPDPARLALDRALDTAAGAVVGLVVAVLAARPEHAGEPGAATAGAAAVRIRPAGHAGRVGACGSERTERGGGSGTGQAAPVRTSR